MDSNTKIVFENVTYAPKRNVLNNISSSLRKNRMIAIMGPSGSGKTTLSKIISGRFNKKYTGKILYNNELLRKNQMMKRTAFIHQNDILLPFLSVRETLEFVCKMRNMDLDLQMVEKLGLTEILDSKVGNQNYGISAGERKRLCIALQLIDQPEIIFLDEPTSGLDSLNALNLIKHLKELSVRSTIVSTIHQPSSEIFFLFDDLIILNRGSIIFDDEVSNIFEFFESRNMKCPQFCNPADFLFTDILPEIDMSSFQQENGVYSEFKPPVDSNLPFKRKQEKNSIENNEENSILPPKKQKQKKKRNSVTFEIKTLFLRNLKCIFRNKIRSTGKMGFSLFVAIVISTFYSGTFNKEEKVIEKDVFGVAYFLVLNCLFSSAMSSLSDIFLKTDMLVREYQSNYYNFISFFVAEALTEILLAMMHPLILLSMVFYFMKYNLGKIKFMCILAACMFTTATGYSLAIFASSTFNSVQVASAAIPSLLLPFTILSGLLIDPNSVAFYLKPFEYLSPTRYSFGIIIKCIFGDKSESLEPLNRKLVDKFVGIPESFGIMSIFIFVMMSLSFILLKRKVKSKI